MVVPDMVGLTIAVHKRPAAYSRADFGEHGRPQAWRVRGNPDVPRSFRRSQGQGLSSGSPGQMEVAAKLRYARISPQKCRLVADQIRGRPVAQALNILSFSPKKAAAIVHKVLESAIANAEHNHGADIDELRVSVVEVDRAPTFKPLPGPGQGQGQQDIQAQQSHYGSGSRRVEQWDRKFIRSEFVSGSRRSGPRSGMPIRRDIRTTWNRTTGFVISCARGSRTPPSAGFTSSDPRNAPISRFTRRGRHRHRQEG